MGPLTEPGTLGTDERRFHALSVHEVLEALATDERGLSGPEVERRRAEVGPNRLPPAPKDHVLVRLSRHFRDVLIIVLLIAAAVTALLRHWLDASVILGVVIINALIGFVQEGKAESALDGIRRMLSPHAHVRRDGAWVDVDAAELVPGDIVRLRSGDRVPADLRLIEAVNLRIEESALTGESVPTSKDPAPVPADAGIGDRHSMAYSGTLVASGRGVGVVTATGPATELGRITKMIAGVETLATPLTRQLAAFGKALSLVILGAASLIFVLGFVLHDYETKDLFLAAIGFAVAAIPEGLPAILTITLAIGVQRMARRNAITRGLPAVETLGSVTVICSDKTGTLTRNEMTVRHVVTRAGRIDVEGIGYAPEGALTADGHPVTLAERPDLQALIEVMAVCNDAHLGFGEDGWQITGEPTEGSLVVLARKAGFETHGYHRRAVVPFESEHKLMATLDTVPGHPDHTVRILVKGAPDRLLDRCRVQLGADGATEPLDRHWWEEQIRALAAEGLRVLAAARRDMPSTTRTLELVDVDDLVFVGLVGILDPPRPEAIAAVATCKSAGIAVKMITGDHADTAEAIAREMGIGRGAGAVTGTQLEAASDEELRQLVRDHDVFARTSPEHKLRIVTALQAEGHVVAMTGDGVNDAPALKRADVGVAMGIKGTEATKESAEIVLADDNFASIERAVEEGRTIYDNIRKAILFILPTNGAQGFVILVAVITGMTLPLSPVQILWVNMVTAVTLAVSLAFEPPEPGIMRRPPRDPRAPILGAYFLWRIALVSLLVGGATVLVFLAADWDEQTLPQARTLALTTLVFGEVCYLFNSRYLRDSSLRVDVLRTNRAVWVTIAVLAMLQLLYVYAPFMHRLFGSASLPVRDWVVAAAIGFGVFLLVEVEKWVVRTWRR